MLSRATARRAFAAVVATAAVASVGATAADAKVVTVTDDAAAEFWPGTQGNTVVAAARTARWSSRAPWRRSSTASP